MRSGKGVADGRRSIETKQVRPLEMVPSGWNFGPAYGRTRHEISPECGFGRSDGKLVGFPDSENWNDPFRKITRPECLVTIELFAMKSVCAGKNIQVE